MPDRFLTEDEWELEFQPGNVLEDFPVGIDPKYMWTEVESDGFWSIASGNHFVNRTGRYYVSVLPHDFDVFVEEEEIPYDEEE